MEHRRQASPEEIEWLGPGTRGDTCRVADEDPNPKRSALSNRREAMHCSSAGECRSRA